MRRPKMILFDYGQTLADEGRFNGIKGTEAVLRHAARNRHGFTAAQVQAAADEINAELGRFDPARWRRQTICSRHISTSPWASSCL